MKIISTKTEPIKPHQVPSRIFKPKKNILQIILGFFTSIVNWLSEVIKSVTFRAFKSFLQGRYWGGRVIYTTTTDVYFYDKGWKKTTKIQEIDESEVPFYLREKAKNSRIEITNELFC